MTATLAMFPGQGSQYVGMGREALAQFPSVKDVFEQAEDSARLDIRRLCLDGPEDQLNLTAHTQPCVLTVNVAIFRILSQEVGFAAGCYAGHSLGEYAALVCSGKLDFDQAVKLVHARGQAMQAAVAPGLGAMVAVINHAVEDLAALCNRISGPGAVAEIVNFNSPQQVVIAGHKTAVEKVCEHLATESTRFVSLPVSAPFHSSLMEPAKEAMRPLLLATKMLASDAEVIPNVSAEITTEYTQELLIEQIDSPVRWTQTLETALAHGTSRFVEIGPGKVLFGLARRTLPRKDVQIFHTDNLRDALAAFGR